MFAKNCSMRGVSSYDSELTILGATPDGFYKPLFSLLLLGVLLTLLQRRASEGTIDNGYHSFGFNKVTALVL